MQRRIWTLKGFLEKNLALPALVELEIKYNALDLPLTHYSFPSLHASVAEPEYLRVIKNGKERAKFMEAHPPKLH